MPALAFRMPKRGSQEEGPEMTEGQKDAQSILQLEIAKGEQELLPVLVLSIIMG